MRCIYLNLLSIHYYILNIKYQTSDQLDDGLSFSDADESYSDSDLSDFISDSTSDSESDDDHSRTRHNRGGGVVVNFNLGDLVKSLVAKPNKRRHHA